MLSQIEQYASLAHRLIWEMVILAIALKEYINIHRNKK
jgi:hypothetical protein